MEFLGTMLAPMTGVIGTSLGVFSWSVSLLEPAVAGYALRLYRILGKRVGWWVCASFCLLALGHLLQGWGATPRVVGPSISFDLIAFVSPLLLLIGMVHTERTFAERADSEQKQNRIRIDTESKVQRTVTALVRERDALQEQVAQFSKREKALEDSARQYDLLFTSNPQPMLVFDLRSHRMLAVNHAAVARYGFSTQEFLTKSVRDLIPEQAGAAFLADVAQPAPAGQPRGVWPQRCHDGTLFEAELSAVDLRYGDAPARLIVASDVSRQRRTEARLRQEEKLQAIGRVAGTVGEHFDNLIHSIASEAEALLKRPQEPGNERALKQITTATNQAMVLAQQLLTAGGRRFAATEALDFNRFLEGLEPTLGRLLGVAIRLQTKYGPDVPFIMGDALLLEQVMLNLVMNARSAMPRGGTLAIETSLVRFSQDSVETGRRAGEFVCIVVRDTGCGISSEVQARLFEPFCTTRQSGKGLGLGLASVYGTVKQLAGWTELETRAAQGTEVRMYFPACAPRPIVRPKAPVAVGNPVAPKTILLVEPNDRLRLMARSVLEWKGYRVIETDSASLALTIWPGKGHTADLLLVDWALPGSISGRELANRLCEGKPALKVIFTCDKDQTAQIAGLMNKRQLLGKPFASVELLDRVSCCFPENG